MSSTHTSHDLTLLSRPTCPQDTEPKAIEIYLTAIGNLTTTHLDGSKTSKSVYLNPPLREVLTSYTANAVNGAHSLPWKKVKEVIDSGLAHVHDHWSVNIPDDMAQSLQEVPPGDSDDVHGGRDQLALYADSFHVSVHQPDAYKRVTESGEGYTADRGIPCKLYVQDCLQGEEYSFLETPTIEINRQRKTITVDCLNTLASASGHHRFMDTEDKKSLANMEKVLSRALYDVQVSLRKTTLNASDTEEVARRLVVQSVWPQWSYQSDADTSKKEQDIAKALQGFTCKLVVRRDSIDLANSDGDTDRCQEMSDGGKVALPSKDQGTQQPFSADEMDTSSGQENSVTQQPTSRRRDVNRTSRPDWLVTDNSGLSLRLHDYGAYQQDTLYMTEGYAETILDRQGACDNAAMCVHADLDQGGAWDQGDTDRMQRLISRIGQSISLQQKHREELLKEPWTGSSDVVPAMSSGPFMSGKSFDGFGRLKLVIGDSEEE